MAKKIIAVTGATGHVGKVIVQKLREAGHEVRKISRKSGVPDDDQIALTNAFYGADAAFLMLPPDFKTLNLRKRCGEIGSKLASAVKAAGVKRVVFLSSLNAHLSEHTGPILGLHDTEERLNALGIPELTHLRPAYFMENHLGGAEYIAHHGNYGTALRPDIAIPMIATIDIGTGRRARRGVPRFGSECWPRAIIDDAGRRILGKAIDMPDFSTSSSYDQARQNIPPWLTRLRRCGSSQTRTRP